MGSDRSLHAEMSGYDLALAVRALRRAARDAPAVRGIAERDYSDDDLAAMTPGGLMDLADALILLQARVLHALARGHGHPRSGSDPHDPWPGQADPPLAEPVPPPEVPPRRPRTRRRDTA